MCEDRIKTHQVIKELGEFNANEKPLKRGARIGQNFASTKPIRKLPQLEDPAVCSVANDETGNPKNTVFEVADVESDHPGIPFTDGAGNIHEDLAREINEHFRIKYCTAYQIRIAGYKGVLVLKENDMKGLVEVRPSMRKYKGQDFDLGIIRCATYSVAYLNRQVIMLLSKKSLKVPDALFLKMQTEAIKRLNKGRMHRSLIHQVRSYMDHPSTSDISALHREFELHFGPSQQFKQIFVKALIYEVSAIQAAN